MKLTGRTIREGEAEGVALVTRTPLSFYGGIDPTTGRVIEKGHELYGEFVKEKVLVFPYGKGSTVGSYIIYRLKKGGLAPVAIVNESCETIVAVGAIISEIPCVDQINIESIRSGATVRVKGDTIWF